MSFLPKGIIERYREILNIDVMKNVNTKITIPNKQNPTNDELIYGFLLKFYNELPKVPEYLFNTPATTGTTGTTATLERDKSTDAFFIIRYEMQKLEQLQNMIINVLEQLHYEFSEIQFDYSRFGINPTKDNVVNVKDCKSYSEFMKMFKINGKYPLGMNDFINNYKQKSHSLFSFNQGVGSGMPNYYRFINVLYKGKSKKFVLKMMKDYMKVSKILNRWQNKYNGILAFENIFDISKKPIIQLFKQKKINYVDDFNLDFNNKEIYNNTKSNQNEPGSNTEISAETEEALDYMMLDFDTNMYDQVGNDSLYKADLGNKLKEISEKICELLNEIYKTRKMNLLKMVTISLKLDFYTQQFIFYYCELSEYQKALKTRDEVYNYINARIEIYEGFIEDFIEWIKIAKTGITGFTVNDPRLMSVFTDFTQFYSDLFNMTREERQDRVRQRLTQMGITVIENVNLADMSPEELSDIESLTNQLIRILESSPSSTTSSSSSPSS